MTRVGDSAAETRRRLEEAADGLLYSSEGDHPFTWVELPAPAGPLDADAFRALIGADPGTRVEEVDLARFLRHHTDAVDPYDERAQALRPRYERLRDVLVDRLAPVRVFRVGTVRIDCYLVGPGPDGRLAGLHTVAIET